MQMRVLEAYTRLGSQKLVAQELGISYQTVKNHLTHLYVRLGVNGAIEALNKMGWIAAPTTTRVVPCGHLAYCTRSENHRGQHGGYRAFIRMDEDKEWTLDKLEDQIAS
jgi:hypothetical protein